MNSALQGMQAASASAAKSARNLAVPKSSGPEMQNHDSLKDIVDLSSAAQGMKASAVVFSVAADMSDVALSIGNRLDTLA